MGTRIFRMKDFELNHVLAGFARDNVVARNWRGESGVGNLEADFMRIYTGRDADEDVKSVAAVTAGHDVESFVSELKKRVGLEALSKTASKIPLHKTAKKPEAPKE